MLDRLLEIIYILMNRGKVTAKELAERFEISTRTIYRDVEHLSMAGIPIYATKGKNGGISLTEQFVLDKRLVSKEEQQEILAALVSLQETGAGHESETLRKLGEFFQVDDFKWVSIDFSDWSGRRQELYEQLKESILSKKKIRFDYYGQYGEMSNRTVHPMQLLFKEYTWYLKAFCENRSAVRLFKVLRMKRVEVLDEHFGETEIIADENSKDVNSKGVNGKDVNGESMNAKAVHTGSTNEEAIHTEIHLLIDKKEAYRVYDRFEEEDITVLENGDFLIRTWQLVDDWVYGVILSFGPSAEVLAPEFVKEEVKHRIAEMLKKY